MSTNIPKVILSYNGNVDNLLQQDYPDLIIESNIDNIQTAEFFNSVANKYDGGIYGFLDSYHNFTDPQAISKIINIFTTLPKIVGVYSDNYIVNNNFTKYNVLPTFNQLLFENPNNIINVPMFMCLKSQQTFDVKIKQLFWYDFLLTIRGIHTFYHIAEPLIVIQEEPIQIGQDLSYIRQKHYKR